MCLHWPQAGVNYFLQFFTILFLRFPAAIPTRNTLPPRSIICAMVAEACGAVNGISRVFYAFLQGHPIALKQLISGMLDDPDE
jgi:hypothetical protein